MPRSRTRWAIRPVRTRVFPLPAPARIRSGPPGCSTAWRCTELRSTALLVLESYLEIEVVLLQGCVRADPARRRVERLSADLLPSKEKMPGPAVLGAQALGLLRRTGEVARILNIEFRGHVLSDPEQTDRVSGRIGARRRTRFQIDGIDEAHIRQPAFRVAEKVIPDGKGGVGTHVRRQPLRGAHLFSGRTELPDRDHLPEIRLAVPAVVVQMHLELTCPARECLIDHPCLIGHARQG